MRIAVIGAGGVGGWLAARLWSAGADVHVVARGAHLAAIQAQGLTLTSPMGDVRASVAATDDAASIGPCDAVLLCVKAYDTAAAAALLPGLCHDTTVVASLQNGIGNAAELARALGPQRVVGGLVLISSTVSEPGVVLHSGGPARVVLGDLPGSAAGGAERLVTAMSVPGVDARRSDRIEVELWDKFAFLCAVAGTTATTRLPLGEVRACPASWSLFAQLLTEVYRSPGRWGSRSTPKPRRGRSRSQPAWKGTSTRRCTTTWSPVGGSSSTRCTARSCASARNTGSRPRRRPRWTRSCARTPSWRRPATPPAPTRSPRRPSDHPQC